MFQIKEALTLKYEWHLSTLQLCEHVKHLGLIWDFRATEICTKGNVMQSGAQPTLDISICECEVYSTTSLHTKQSTSDSYGAAYPFLQSLLYCSSCSQWNRLASTKVLKTISTSTSYINRRTRSSDNIII